LIEGYCRYASGRLQTLNIKITLFTQSQSLLTYQCLLRDIQHACHSDSIDVDRRNASGRKPATFSETGYLDPTTNLFEVFFVFFFD